MRITVLLLTIFSFLSTQQTQAQKTRFSGIYPLCKPDESARDLIPEYEMTMQAIAGGCRLADDPKTLKKREDPEAFIKDDYEETLLEMVAYAEETAEKLIKADGPNASDWKKKGKFLGDLEKDIKKGKFINALNALMQEKVDTKAEIEKIYFIWKDYLRDIEQDVSWIQPINRRTTRHYRNMLHYVSNSFDRPFGAQAQIGGVVADAAQALSNCMEDPREQAWQGEGKITMKREDEIRRLASDVSYFEWRLHDPTNARRAYAIDLEAVTKVRQALYEVVATMTRLKGDWYQDPNHGENLQILHDLTYEKGWRVDGTNALKETAKEKEELQLDEQLPTRRLY